MDIASGVILLLVVILTLFYILQYWWKGRYLWKTANKIPGPKEYPILGNILDALAWTPEESFQKYLRLVRRYSPTARFWIGPHLIISFSDPRDLEILMNSEKCLGRESIKYVLDIYTLGDGLIPIGGEQWKIHRKFIASSFQYSHFEFFIKVFNKNSAILMKCLTEASSGDENCIDIIQYLTRFAFDSVCETLMGVEMKSQERGEERFIESMDTFVNTVTKMFLNPWLLSDVIIRLTGHHKRMTESTAYMNSFCRELIADKSREFRERQKNAATPKGSAEIDSPSLIEAIMQMMHNGECPFSKDEIIGELNYMIMAGMDTTATALSFVMMLLGFHQDVQKRLQEELDGIFGDEPERPVSTEDLKNLKYTEQVIKETLRLHPLVPFVPRTCNEDIHMNGYTIPKGSDLLFNLYSLHRDPEIYPNPDEFDPENFTPERSKGRHPYGFVPFSSGMRRCVGHRYAMIQMKVVIAHVLRRFDVRPVCDREDMDRWQLHFTLKLVKGFKIILVPRH